MKKLFIIAILMLGIASFAFAENSATGMNGTRYYEEQVFVTAYNGSGTDISSNYVVVIDTSATRVASGSTLGAYIATTTTAADARVVGVTDETITNGRAGRVCVRGPHKVYLTAAPTLGATVATTTTAGAGVGWTASQPGNNQFGVALSATAIGGGGAYAGANVVNDGWIWGEGTNNYWVWIGGPSR